MSQYWDDELCHYGILGMKWGVRRYENADGTLTPAGKARYSKYTESSDHAAYRETKKKPVESLSNKELQAYNQRANLEREFRRNKANAGSIKRGEETLKTVLSVGTTVTSIVALANTPGGKKIIAAGKKVAAAAIKKK